MKKLLLLLVPVLMLMGCGGNTIDAVKSGSLNLDLSITIDDAFSDYKYFESTSWETFENAQNQTFVQFNGVFDLDEFVGSPIEGWGRNITDDDIEKYREKTDVKITYFAQFKISKSDESFELYASAINFSGVNPNTGEIKSKNSSDDNLAALTSIYGNKPELTTMAFVLSMIN
ncbi:hypothetical protein [Shewanella sp. ALD9]|uniref:hypothetical protein n=1 Tax=Shewanella sp. ALD9 TaxID=2058330 RepID=UPI000C33EDEA|nr:hypothetical protein [Shewanella sp. ALD9]PKH31458.1 hypothetical protein CXF88_12975 [Shewanella sp. ALD9]